MRAVDIIQKKRDGQVLSTEEITSFIQKYTEGSIPDYQAAALLMAVYFQKMNRRETVDLVKAMIDSGDTMDLSGIDGIKVDKHSTGGVGDKTTITLGPLVASFGVPVAKMSGRGLGHTGGTIDKLEAIPGFRTDLSETEFIDHVNRCGIAVAGQTGHLVPADKKLYALRDVTATIENTSLIAGSIMSKKLAAGSDAIVLDVKMGKGAFMKTKEEAFTLAQEMVNIGWDMGRETVALVTAMEEPLGFAVGNSIEIKEAIETLQGKGPEDFKELCIALATQMLVLAKRFESVQEAQKAVTKALETGAALEKLKEFIAIQGGNPAVVEDFSLLPEANNKQEVRATEEGYVVDIDAHSIGRAAMLLGAGRQTKDSVLDLSAGIYLQKKIGDYVRKDEILAVLHYNQATPQESTDEVQQAYRFSASAVPKQPLIYGIVTKDGIQEIEEAPDK